MTTASLELLPAVDVLGGRAVHLVRGRAESARAVGDPVATALRWQAAGASWVHLVDLDAAFGRSADLELLAAVVGALDIDVELSAGVRDQSSLDAALATGCRRVVLATDAMAEPDWCDAVLARWPERLAVALDVRGNALSARGTGWAGGPVQAAVQRLDAAGCRCLLVTDVERDGALAGPNIDLLRSVCRRTNADVVASGGVSSVADLKALAALRADGLAGVVVGAALHSGAFTLGEALAAVRDAPLSRRARS